MTSQLGWFKGNWPASKTNLCNWEKKDKIDQKNLSTWLSYLA
jgi:hypothetical protein